MKLYLIGGAALLAFAPALAQVATAPAPAPHAQHAMAKAHTRAEVQAHVGQMFARLDANRDGAITREEAQAGRQAFRQHATERRGERRAQAFDRLDTNRDGALSRQEFEARRAHRAGSAGEPRRGHRMGGMGGIGGRMFDMADANRDARVTLPEATAAALRHFDMADANRNGRVTPEERREMHRQMRAANRPG